MLSAHLLRLYVGPVQVRGADKYSRRPWATGFYKAPVESDVWLGVPSPDGTRAGLQGDAQADLVFHGGPEKAVCVYPSEHYPFWRQALSFEAFPFGAFGENFTLAGLTEAQVCIGDEFVVGDGPDAARVQVSQPRQPCWKLARRWNVKDLAFQVQQNGKSGWYFRVLHEGFVRSGQTLRLIERPYPEWPLTLCNQIMHSREDNSDAVARLAACPLLSVQWRQWLSERVA